MSLIRALGVILSIAVPAAAAYADGEALEAPRDPSDRDQVSPDAPEPDPADAEGDALEPLIIEGIEIIGNEKTDRQVILRRLATRAGDLVVDQRIEESRLRLLGTGFFNRVEFSLRRGSKRGRVLLVVEVEERNTIQIDELTLGFSSVSPVFGGIGLVETNFLGKGVAVGGNVVAGQHRRAVELRTFVPDLANTPLQLLGSFIALRGAEVVDPGDPERLRLDYRRFGGTVGFGFGVGAAQRVALIYRLESIQTDRLPNVEPAILRRAPSVQYEDSVLSSLIASYELDTRDDPFVPSQGTRLALAVEVGTQLLGSTYEFSKYTGELQHALPVFGRHSLILRLFGGLIQGQTPFFNQFFVADHAYMALGRPALPRSVQLNFSPHNDYDDLVISGGAEYAVPLIEGGDLLYRLFLYGGVDLSATASLEELQEDARGRGTGRYVPVSFDFGVKLDTWLGNFRISGAYVFNLLR